MVASLMLSLLMGVSPADEQECRQTFEKGQAQTLAEALPELSSHPIIGTLFKEARVVRSDKDAWMTTRARFFLTLPKRSAVRHSFTLPLPRSWSGRIEVNLPSGFGCTQVDLFEEMGQQHVEFAVPQGSSVKAVITHQKKKVLDQSMRVSRLGAVDMESGTNLMFVPQQQAAPSSQPAEEPEAKSLLMPVQGASPKNEDGACGALLALSMTFPDAHLEDAQCMERVRGALAKHKAELAEQERGKDRACSPSQADGKRLCVSYEPEEGRPGVLRLVAGSDLPGSTTVKLRVGDQLLGTSMQKPSVSLPWDGCTWPAGSREAIAEVFDAQGKSLQSARLPLPPAPADVPPVLSAAPSDSGVLLQWSSCGSGAQDTLYWGVTPEVDERSQPLAQSRSPSVHKVPLDGTRRFYRLASRREGKVLWSKTVSAAPSARVCGSGWCMDSPRFSERGLDAAWAAAPNDVWAVGDSGLFHWDGKRWAWTPVAQRLFSISGSGADDVWAVGYWAKAALHWDGRTWSPVTLPREDLALRSVWVASRTEAWAVGDRGVILKWDGTTWSAQSSPSQESLQAVWGSGPGNVWAVGSLGTALHWDGSSWQSVPVGIQQDLLSVWGSGEKDVWAVGGKGLILHWDGTRWSSMESPTMADLGRVTGTSSQRARALANDGTVLSWDGMRWSLATASTSSGEARGPGASAASWVPGEELAWGALLPTFRWEKGRWRPPLQNESGDTMYDVTALPDGTAWAVGSGASMRFWNGTAWEDHSVKGSTQGDALPLLQAVWAAGPGQVWAGGAQCTVLRSQGGGWEWTSLCGDSSAINDIWGSAPDAVWAVGSDGGAYFWNGTAWSRSQPVKGALNGVAGSSRKDVWAVGAGGTAIHWDGATWTPQPTGVTETLIAVSVRGNEVWAVGSGGIVLQWMGKGWRRHDVPEAPPLLNKVWVAGPNDVWASGLSASVFHWDGRAWSRSLALDSRSAYPTALAGNGQKLWFTGGSSIYVRDASR